MPKVLKNDGLTLIGLLTAMFLIILVLSTANSLFVFGIKAYYLNLDRLEVQENLRVGLDRVSRELRQAVRITTIEDHMRGRLTFIDLKQDVISYRISKSGDTEAVYQLIRSSDGSGHNSVARYITGINVKPANADQDVRTVHLKLTGEKGGSGIMDVSTTVTLRNWTREMEL
ncbi:PilW family protein [Desulfoscipio sp. XC116]|uniref:PilW family protein n=1 Tax=Desulfoscipio sp. XC116 TaxID=3144975 RepID=UPI00325A82B0